MKGSRISSMRTGSGMSVGLWTSSSSPLVSVTSYPTLGIVASSSRSYSRSQALAHDVHVQQPEEAAAEAEAERVATSRAPRSARRR